MKKLMIAILLLFSVFLFLPNKVYGTTSYNFEDYYFEFSRWSGTFNETSANTSKATYLDIVEVSIPNDYIYDITITGSGGAFYISFVAFDSNYDFLGYAPSVQSNLVDITSPFTDEIVTLDISGINWKDDVKYIAFNFFNVTNIASNSIEITDATLENDFIRVYNTFNVSFNSNGGTTVNTINNVSNDSTITAPTSPTRLGYTFDAWYKESNFTNVWNFSTDKITVDITLYAKWVYDVWIVTFNSNGGSAVTAQEVDPDDYAIEPTEPTRSGYQFQGWFTDDSTFLNEWDFETDTVTEDITLYAKWYEGWQVTFDSNGGSAVSNIENVANDTTITAPTPPTRAGYNFIRWDYISDSGPPIVFSAWNFTEMTVTSNLSLFAVWKEVLVVTFNSNGGTAIDSQNVESGDFASLPVPPPTRTGYTFNGWYDDDGTFLNEWDAEQFGTQGINEDITLYAKWVINEYTVTFESNGGTAVISQQVEYNSYATEPTAPTRVGYTFDGWYLDDDTFLNPIFFESDPITNNVTLYAKWVINEWTAYFNTQSGSPIPADQTLDYGELVIQPTTPTRNNFTFGGWYTSTDFNVKWKFNIDTMPDNDLVLYAKWIPDIEDAIDDYLAGTLFGTPFGKMLISIVFIVSLIVILGLMKASGSIVFFMTLLMFVTFIALDFIPAWIVIVLFILMFVVGYLTLSGNGKGVIVDD